MAARIIGTGNYIPEKIIGEKEFLQHQFYDTTHQPIDADPAEIIRKFRGITGIEERRYARPDQQTSDMATMAAREAVADAAIDPETLDGIIVAHNYGNIPSGQVQSDTVPSLAARVKHNLGIRNAGCVAFDVLFGCPGWIQGMIIANQFLKTGAAKRYLVIGAETLSRVLDVHDRDSMIYADGAGAVIAEWDDAPDSGILSTASRSFTYDEVYYLNFETSLKPGATPGTRFIRMQGRKIYEFALNQVPLAMKACLDQSGIAIDEVKKVFLHQANEKMDEAIGKRFFALYGKESVPAHMMPMTIHKLGNSSVATVPTLLDLVRKGKLPEHELHAGDVILLASVGAGMNINAIVYKV
ncbi:3-oxoacyl-ACP synthase III family protein [Taibaiella koreensis]|uniref:3-oxoacyl-ACP synthase III family protein n=1 Tax=Taibaiella koreensis TaxID=1268548 RepID=UPI000E59E529|nr:ketoacyl-ACP synthase III [Taibaiella koreensis]